MADIINNGYPNPIMVYGRAPNGQLQAVTTDGAGNLSVAGGSGGLANVTSLPATCTPGVTAPVNLTVAPFGIYVCGPNANQWTVDPTYFGRFFGLAPQNFGAKGDTQVYFNCGMTTNNHVTCGSAHFQASDVGKWFESCAAGGSCPTGSTINQGTITAFNSSTDVTVSVTAGTTYSNTRFAFGTDDDAAMQSWVAAMITAPTNGIPPQVRGGYLPQGGYAIKQPVKIIYPTACGGSSSSTCGEGAPTQGGGGTLTPGLWLVGASASASFIYVRTGAVFTWPTTSDDIGAVTIGNWAFGTIQNFAVIGDQQAHTTTGVTGNIGGLVFSGFSGGSAITTQHVYTNSVWVQGFHNSGSNMCGLVTAKNDFESSYMYSAVEANDFNGCFGNSQSGQTGGTLLEKIHIDTIFFENPGGINVVVGTTTAGASITLKQISFTNCHSLNLGGSNFTHIRFVSTTTVNQEVVQFFNWRQTTAAGGSNIGFRLDNAGTMNVDLHGSYLEDTSGGAGSVLFSNLSANHTVSFYGGSINCTSCTNAFNNAGNIFVYGTKLTGPSAANIQTGAGNTYAFIPQGGANGGWNGAGFIQVSALKTVTNCAVNSISPAACGSAPTGAFVVPTTTTTYTVNTTAVSANSVILLFPRTNTGNLPGTPTCTTPAITSEPVVTAISAGASFTLGLASTTGQTCWNYWIVN